MTETYKEQIQHMARTTGYDNAQIAAALGCSQRTVRRHAGPFADRFRKLAKGKEVKLDPAKILLLDLETSPMEAFVWQLKQQGWINTDAVIKDWSILTWSAKWLFGDQVISARVNAEDAYNRKDGSVIKELWDLLEEANIVVAHNGTHFDIRRCNARFALNGLGPTLPYRVIDTLLTSRRVFDFASYKLDYINQLFGLNQKGHPGFQVWKDAVSNNEYSEEALENLRGYCDNDIQILEELYLQIRPWIKGHPNIGLYIDTDSNVCDHCGNPDLDWGGKYYTPAGRFLSFRCGNCGAIGRKRTTDLGKEERKRLCVGVA